MIILFTTSKYPTSWLIRKLTGEDCSHCAIFTGDYMVCHINFLGIQVQTLEEFKEHNQIQHIVSVPYNKLIISTELEEKFKSVKYDFGALLYAGLRILFRRWLPKANLWQTTGMFLCTEFITELIDDKEDSMITPHGLYNRLNIKQEN